MRIRNKPWALEYLQQHEDFVDIDMTYKYKVNSRFKVKQPLHLEVGTGMGRFITEMARRNPHVNFIGVEVDKNIMIRAAEKAHALALENVQLVLLDANHLEDYFNAHEIEQLYLNFSDPWPKNRHEKRRLTSKGFLEQYKTILSKGGQLQFKTDNRGLFEYSLLSMNNLGMTFLEVNLNLHRSEPPNNVRTEYEDKFSKQGFVIYQLKASF